MTLQSIINTISICNHTGNPSSTIILTKKVFTPSKTEAKFCYIPTADEISESVTQLIQAVGKERLERICKMPEINIDTSQLESKTLILTIQTMQKILVGLLNPHQDDFVVDSGKVKYVGPLPNEIKKLRTVLMDLLPSVHEFKVDKAQTSGKGFRGLIERFFASFSAPHCSQYTLFQFSCKHLTGEDAQKHLRLGNLFEKARLVLAYFIHFATFTFFNGSSFAKFYQEQKAILEVRRNTASEKLIPETN